MNKVLPYLKDNIIKMGVKRHFLLGMFMVLQTPMRNPVQLLLNAALNVIVQWVKNKSHFCDGYVEHISSNTDTSLETRLLNTLIAQQMHGNNIGRPIGAKKNGLIAFEGS